MEALDPVDHRGGEDGVSEEAGLNDEYFHGVCSGVL